MKQIKVHCVPVVQDRGQLVIETETGEIKQFSLNLFSASEFFEKMMVGKNWEEAPILSSHTGGSCSVGQTLATIKATEAAFGVRVSRQTALLRNILLCGEILQCHALHVCFLPGELFPGKKNPVPSYRRANMVQHAFRLSKLGTLICEKIGGRSTHPIACVVGGFSKVPSKETLREVREELYLALSEFNEIVEFFEGLSWPMYYHQTESVALKRAGKYCFYDGEIARSGGKSCPVSDYGKVIGLENPCRLGALARYTISGSWLVPEAKSAAHRVSLDKNTNNPFFNSAARIVECIQITVDSIRNIDRLLETGLKEESLELRPREGKGVGAVELSRGTLFHEYGYNGKGRIVSAKCILPTEQNFASMERDLKALVLQLEKKPKQEVNVNCEMLLRAYDPSNSWFNPLLKIDWV